MRLSFLSYEAEEKDDAPEQPERQRVSFAIVDEAEKEVECRHAPEKDAECPDHSPEEEAEEEADCPDSPEEEESEASSSEG